MTVKALEVYARWVQWIMITKNNPYLQKFTADEDPRCGSTSFASTWLKGQRIAANLLDNV